MNTYLVTTTKRQEFVVKAHTMLGTTRVANRRAWAEYQAGVDSVAEVA